MRHRKLAALLSMMLVAALLAPSPASAVSKSYTAKTEKLSVKTRHGRMYVEVTRPMDGDKTVKGPAVLTISPYSVLGRSNVAKAWVSEGYVSVFADVIGTGNSGGCYDYGGKREKETGYDVVEWIAKQPWSTGKVGMIGGSYNGTTANATAVMDPPHLTTIVPEAAISRWYGYAYGGGIRYLLNNEKPADEGVDTPLAFDFGLAIPPPLDVTDPHWAEKVASTITPCEEIQHTEKGYDDTPDYDKFWLERDYVKDAHKVDIPVLVAHNWGDWNVKQDEAWEWYQALRKRSDSPNVKLYMGNRWSGHGKPGGNYDDAVKAWFDHYLMGNANGAQNMPDVHSQMANSDGPLGFYKGGLPKTRNVELIAQYAVKTAADDYDWKLLPSDPITGGFISSDPASFPSMNINTEAHANHHGRSHHDWWWFESPVLKRDTRIFGEIKVQLYSSIDRKWVTLTPTVVDVDPSCHATVGNQHMVKPECTTDIAPGTVATPKALVSVTRGWLDSRYRKSLSKQTMLDPGKPFLTTVVEHPQDYTFKKGHIIALNVATEINEWSLPKPYPGCESMTEACAFFNVHWAEGKTRLILPIVNAPKNAMDLFDFGHAHH